MWGPRGDGGHAGDLKNMIYLRVCLNHMMFLYDFMISPWLMVIELIFNGSNTYIYKGYVIKYMANNMYLDELY